MPLPSALSLDHIPTDSAFRGSPARFSRLKYDLNLRVFPSPSLTAAVPSLDPCGAHA